MKVLIKAYSAGSVSPKAEDKIGRLMKSRAVKEGHTPRLPANGKPWGKHP